jgi:sortase A
MSQRRETFSRTYFIEQAALLLTSFVWTVVILTGLGLLWAYQDAQAQWGRVLGMPDSVQAEVVAVVPTPSGTPTPWRGPGATPVPAPTSPPTPTPTLVVRPPEILPDTPNLDDPTPIPVIVHTPDEVAAIDNAAAVVDVAEDSSTNSSADDSSSASTNPADPTPPAAIEAPAPADIPERLVIPAIGVDSGIIPVGWRVVEQNGRQFSIWEVASYAVGWHRSSASPGQPGNTVLAGHHNIQGEVFRDLVNLEVGDEVTLYAAGQAHHYRVELKTIVKEKGEPIEVRRKNAQWIAPTTDERITMVTCWPYTNNTHRVIVVAKPL